MNIFNDELLDKINVNKIEAEYLRSKDEYAQGLLRYRMIAQLLNISGKNGLQKWSIGKRNHFYEFLKSKDGRCKVDIGFGDLEDRYLVTKLILKENSCSDYSLNKKTKFENEFKELLRKKTNKKIYNSFLIGKVSADFYIPSLALVLEIDGGIHDTEPKMKKDQMKVDIQAELGVKVASIMNEDVEKGARNSKTVQSLLSNINKVPLLNSRTQKLILARIYLLTVCCNKSQFEILFGITPDAPLSYFFNSKKNKGVSSSRSKLPTLDLIST